MDVQDEGGSQGSKLLLASALNHSHHANMKAYPGTTAQLDARAEVRQCRAGGRCIQAASDPVAS
jgi:hypothetical protein